MSSAEPASPVTPTSPNGSQAPNHDSMVTVSLSDIQSNAGDAPDWRTLLDLPPPPMQKFMETHGNNTELFGPIPLQDAAKTNILHDEPATPTSTELKQIDEDKELEPDWESLDKTEEQEPRGEGSDDVSGVGSRKLHARSTLTARLN